MTNPITHSIQSLPVQSRFDFLRQLFAESGAILRAAYRSGSIKTETKEALSPMVTAVDRAVEEALTNLIRRAFPDDAIWGEEDGLVEGNSPYQWIIDPIDGTSSFVRGLPLFGTLIGCVERSSGTILFGGADQPILGDQIVAIRGASPIWNGTAVVNRYREDKNALLSEACLCATTPLMFSTAHEQRVLDAAIATCRRTAWGGDWFNYGLMIGGGTTIPLVIVEAGLNYYDICALVPIIEEAGGVITDWQGLPVTEKTSQVIAAPSQQLWKQLLEVTRTVE
jgi:histidinol phosphatase-like enzyme (inositol monophosphatase family)